jgi:excisionase family DNA binding protein
MDDFARHVQPVLITVKETAAILDCAPCTVMRHIKAGRIAYIRLGQTYRVDKTRLLAEIRRQRID